MLVQLTHEEIWSHWPLLRKSIEESHPPTVVARDGYYANVLKSLYTGEKQAWIGIDEGREVMIGITSTQYDNDTGEKQLLIYSLLGLFSQKPVSERFWMEGRDSVLRYAQNEGYSKIVAFTTYQDVVKLARRLGFTTEWTMVELEV